MQISPAVAAYSLRSLTGGDPRVVRVRRESDNDERDFTASEVGSGALVNYVNTQVTKPLDVKELQSDGRTGNFVIAKAAYSLRSLGDRQATVAATGDTVARADGKYVIQVRRSSDDTIKSFTADEVTDGTLVAFVGSGNDGFVRTWYDQSVSDQAGSTATNNHAAQFTAGSQPKIVESGSLILQNGDATIKFDGTDDSFSPVTISSSSFPVSVISLSSPAVTNSTMGIYGIAAQSGGFYKSTALFSMFAGSRLDSSVSAVAGNDFIRTDIFNGSSSSLSVNGTETTGTIGTGTTSLTKFEVGNSTQSGNNVLNGSIKEIILYTTDQTANRGAFEANIAEHYSISGIPAEDNQVNGFVETWYDQSGNGKDLTQTTADKQPKIVDAGSLVTLSGKPSIKPDGTNDFLINQDSIWDTISNSALSCFTVTEKSSVTNKQLWAIGSTTDNDGDWLIGGASTAGNVQFRGARINSNIVNTGTSGTMLLTAFDVTGGNAFINGTAMDLDGSSPSPSATADRLVLFARRAGDSFTTQRISEAIFYGSDQASNRVDVETNINNHYLIF